MFWLWQDDRFLDMPFHHPNNISENADMHCELRMKKTTALPSADYHQVQTTLQSIIAGFSKGNVT